MSSRLEAIDNRLLKWAYQQPFRDSILIKALIFMGDGPFWLLTLFGAALIGQLSGQAAFQKLPILLMIGFIIANLIFLPCKLHLKRRRPYANPQLQEQLALEIINRDPGHGSKELESFPSGHALWTTLCVGLICARLGLPAILLLGWMIPTMLFLRPYLGVHYPSDALAGLIMGLLCVGLTLLIAPPILGLIEPHRHLPAYTISYWAAILLFLLLAFKNWLKRV